jgi:RNA polymerase sigma factor (sigma-70 family)
MQMKAYSERELIEGLRKGIDECIEYIYTTHFPTVLHFILNNSGSEQDAEDLYQEGFMILVRNIRRDVFEGKSTLKTYLYSICRRQWLKRLTQDPHRKNSFVDYTSFETIPEEEGIDIDEHEQKLSRMDNALVSLGERCEQLLRMFYINGKSMHEIADVLAYTNADNAKTQKYKCLQRLKKAYRDI